MIILPTKIKKRAPKKKRKKLTEKASKKKGIEQRVPSSEIWSH